MNHERVLFSLGNVLRIKDSFWDRVEVHFVFMFGSTAADNSSDSTSDKTSNSTSNSTNARRPR